MRLKKYNYENKKIFNVPKATTECWITSNHGGGGNRMMKKKDEKKKDGSGTKKHRGSRKIQLCEIFTFN